MKLPYLDIEPVLFNDREYRVLDVEAIRQMFEHDPNPVYGRKKSLTAVYEAHGGEVIVTRSSKGSDAPETESRIAQQGDAIMYNPSNPDDTWIPFSKSVDGAAAVHLKFNDVGQAGFIIQAEEADHILVSNPRELQLFVNAVEVPTMIPDVWGEGRHQYAEAGATLKLRKDGRISSTSEDAFKDTWEWYEGRSSAREHDGLAAD